MKIETFCPLFPGFYSTMFEPDETNDIDSHNQEYDKHLTFDDFVWDYKDYQNRVGSAFVESFEKEFAQIIPLDIKFQGIDSPSYYNFRNDLINIEVELDFPRFMEIVNEKKEDIREYILVNYTSRDGFNSFHSNNVDDWCDPEYVLEFIQHRVGALMEALVLTIIHADEILFWAEGEMYLDYQIKYPYSEGDTYFTIEEGEVVESTWDQVSQELHDSNIQYYSTQEEALEVANCDHKNN